MLGTFSTHVDDREALYGFKIHVQLLTRGVKRSYFRLSTARLRKQIVSLAWIADLFYVLCKKMLLIV